MFVLKISIIFLSVLHTAGDTYLNVEDNRMYIDKQSGKRYAIEDTYHVRIPLEKSSSEKPVLDEETLLNMTEPKSFFCSLCCQSEMSSSLLRVLCRLGTKFFGLSCSNSCPATFIPLNYTTETATEQTTKVICTTNQSSESEPNESTTTVIPTSTKSTTTSETLTETMTTTELPITSSTAGKETTELSSTSPTDKSTTEFSPTTQTEYKTKTETEFPTTFQTEYKTTTEFPTSSKTKYKTTTEFSESPPVENGTTMVFSVTPYQHANETTVPKSQSQTPNETEWSATQGSSTFTQFQSESPPQETTETAVTADTNASTSSETERLSSPSLFTPSPTEFQSEGTTSFENLTETQGTPTPVPSTAETGKILLPLGFPNLTGDLLQVIHYCGQCCYSMHSPPVDCPQREQMLDVDCGKTNCTQRNEESETEFCKCCQDQTMKDILENRKKCQTEDCRYCRTLKTSLEADCKKLCPPW